MGLIDLLKELLRQKLDLSIPEDDCYYLLRLHTISFRLVNRKYVLLMTSTKYNANGPARVL